MEDRLSLGSLVSQFAARRGVVGPIGLTLPKPIGPTDNLVRGSDVAFFEPSAQAAFARLAIAGQAATLTPAMWQALGREWLKLPLIEQVRLASRLSTAGVEAQVSADEGVLTFGQGELAITLEPGRQRLRRRQGMQADCYEKEVLIQHLEFAANQVVLTTNTGSEVWTAGTGLATRDGAPLEARPAAQVPGERPRRVAMAAVRNDLREPHWSDKTPMVDYGPAYDKAVRDAGGRVLQPTQAGQAPIDLFNCHAYTTTHGASDIFDPFMRAGYPHWLDNPMHQLLTGSFGCLADTQRIRPGDVVVYRKSQEGAACGVVTHTGVVRAVDPGGNPTLIESKFGMLGLYQHEPTDVPEFYGAPAEFFRPNQISPR